MSTGSTSLPWQLPAFYQEQFRPKKSRYAVLIPVINEDYRIQQQLLAMREIMQEFDSYVVDGGSTDGSLERKFLRATGLAGLLVKTGAGKLGSQLRIGLAELLLRGYEGIILIDGNNKDDPRAIRDFAAALAEGGDHLQGSRFIAGGSHKRTPWMRLLGIRLVHAPLISLAAGRRFTDTTNGFRAYSRRFLLDPRVQPFRHDFVDYALPYYLAIIAGQLGFACKEIPVTRVYPQHEKTPTKIRGLRGNFRIIRILAATIGGAYHPKDKQW